MSQPVGQKGKEPEEGGPPGAEQRKKNKKKNRNKNKDQEGPTETPAEETPIPEASSSASSMGSDRQKKQRQVQQRQEATQGQPAQPQPVKPAPAVEPVPPIEPPPPVQQQSPRDEAEPQQQQKKGKKNAKKQQASETVPSQVAPTPVPTVQPAVPSSGKPPAAAPQQQHAPVPVPQQPSQPKQQQAPQARGPGPQQSGKPAPGQQPPQAPAAKRAPVVPRKIAPNEKTVHIITNMYHLDQDKVEDISRKVFRYELDVLAERKDGNKEKKEKCSANLERSLIYALRQLPQFKGVNIMTDGSKIVYSLKRLEPLVGDELSASMSSLQISQGPKKGQPAAPAPQAPCVYRLKDGLGADLLHPNSKRKYSVILRPAEWDSNDTLQKVQMLQVAVKYSFYEQNRDILLRGKSCFNQDDYATMGDLILFTGVFQSCRFNGYSKPILNVDLSYMVAINSSISVSKWMYGYAEHCGFRNFFEATNNNQFVDGLQYYLSEMNVVAMYGNRAVYKISGVEGQLTSFTAKFENRDGKTTTVADYYKEKYNIIVDKDCYLLIAKQNSPKKEGGGAAPAKGGKKGAPAAAPSVNYLPADHFRFYPGQRRKGDMEANETTEMINHTRKLPAERFKMIDAKVKEVVNNLRAQNIDVGLNIKNIEIDARVLRARTLEYKDAKVVPANGGWDINRFYMSPKQPVKVGVLTDDRFQPDLFAEFAKRFEKTCQEVNFPVARPVQLKVGRNDTFPGLLKANAKQYDCFICMMPPRIASTIYPQIKYASYVELGVITQCIMDEQRQRKGQFWVKVHDMAVLRNIVASLNAKLDQENCCISEVELRNILPIAPADVLVMGLDVFHGETSDPSGKPSVVALCASKSSHFNRFATSLRRQDPRQEMVVENGQDTLTEMIQEVMALRNGPPPKAVMFYRDGVGEGMYEKVLDNEVRVLQRCLGDLFPAAPPKVTFIVAQKRNHLRCVDPNSRDGNPPPGTLVDDYFVIDEEGVGNKFNFYLYSHKALAGTARPTHYQVLLDENNLQFEQVANFTYALTHLHQGCTKTVSIPAPVYYADLACFLAGSCFRQDVEHIQKFIKGTPYMI